MGKEMRFEKSDELFEKARKIIPGGTNSAARNVTSTGNFEGITINYPKFVKSARGSHVYDVDGNEFIDYHLAFGPVILGHANEQVNEAVKKQLEMGTIFGFNTEAEIELSEKIIKHVPCAEMVQIMNTGSAATSAALRLARAYTGKEKIVRFEGMYHGWHDWDMHHRYPASELYKHGIPRSVLDDVIVLPWNDLDIVRKVLKREGDEIAAVITEAYEFNGGVIEPLEGYLEGLREITQDNDILLIFDEVITGFRMGLGGAQKILGVTPDLATIAKAMANGAPISGVVGKKEVFECIADGRVWLGGTYNANPISTASAIATIRELEKEQNYKHLYEMCKKLVKGLRDAIEDVDIEAMVQSPNDKYYTGAGFSLFLTEQEKITQVSQVNSIKFHPHIRRFAVFFQEMVKRGIIICPLRSGRTYLSAAHSEEDINKTIEAAGEALKEAKKIQ